MKYCQISCIGKQIFAAKFDEFKEDYKPNEKSDADVEVDQDITTKKIYNENKENEWITNLISKIVEYY